MEAGRKRAVQERKVGWYIRRRWARIHHGVRGFERGRRSKPRGRTRGIFMATARLLFLFGTRNRACGELAGNPKNIPPLFRFISDLSGLLPSPASPSGSFYSAHRPLSRVFAHPYVRFHLALRLFSRREKRRRVFYRKGPFYLRAEDLPSLWTSPARHANARWRDEILGDGGIPDFNKSDRSSLCAILLFTA